MIKGVIRIKIFLFFIFIGFISCEYNIDEKNDQNLNKNIPPPEIQNLELDLEADSILIKTDIALNFHFISDNQEIVSVKFFLDSILISSFSLNKGTLYIHHNEIEDGMHILNAEIYTKSGTGSLADILEHECYMIKKSWVLISHNDKNYTISSSVQGGFLKLSWPGYNLTDFKEYQIFRTINYYDDSIYLATINEPEFIDSSYVGEGGEYYVNVITVDGIKISWAKADLRMMDVIFESNTNDLNESFIRWNQIPFFNAVDSLTFYQNNILTFTIPNNNDTVYEVVNEYFGQTVDIDVKFIPRNNIFYQPEYYPKFTKSSSLTVGFKFDDHPNTMKQSSPTEFIYLTNNKLKRYSIPQRQIVQSYEYSSTECPTTFFDNFRISPSGNYLTASLGCNNYVFSAQTNNFNSNSIINLQSLTGLPFSPIPVSDINTGIVKTWDLGFFIYDFNQMDTLGYYPNGSGIKISSNGNYIFVKNNDTYIRLVSFIDSQFSNVWANLTNSIKFYEFDGSNPEYFVLWDGYSLYVKKCIDYSTVREFEFPVHSIINIDYDAGEILTKVDGSLHIYNYLDGSLLYIINVSPNALSCLLVNQTIISSMGIMHFIK